MKIVGDLDTQCTVHVCSYWVENKEPNIPVGFANDTAQLFVVNKYGKRVPCGVAREMLVAGPQVGIGCLNQPGKTAQVFIDNPFSSSLSGHSVARVYRTGDIVRYREDGDIEFVGRKDSQVKIRGFRIELKEVESVIRLFPAVKEVTVQPFDYDITSVVPSTTSSALDSLSSTASSPPTSLILYLISTIYLSTPSSTAPPTSITSPKAQILMM